MLAESAHFGKGVKIAKKRFSTFLKLEIDKRLQVSGDKLVNHKHGQHHHDAHQPKRHQRKIDAIPALPTLGEPMYDHTEHKQEIDVPIVLEYVGDDGHIPLPADAGNHILGRVPGGLIGHSGIEVRTRAEKESREGDEHKGHQHVPAEVEPLHIAVREDGRVDGADERARKEDARPDHKDVQHGCWPQAIANQEDDKHQTRNHTAEPLPKMSPDLEAEDADAVQAAPDHKVPGGAVPQTAQQHRVHHIDVGADLQPRPFGGQRHHQQNDRQRRQRRGHHDTLRQHHDNPRNDENAAIGAKGGVAVTAQRDVKVILEPFGERDVPPLPEIAGRVGLIGRIEVLGQVKSHQHRHANGNVSISREVGIHLQRVEEERRQVLERGEKRGVVEDAVHEVHRQIVAQYQFLGQSVQNPEHRDAELAATEEELLVELRHELVGTDDGTRHQLREETDIEAEIQDIAHILRPALIHIHHIADILEGIERDTHGQENLGGIKIGGARQLVAPLRQPVDNLVLAADDSVVGVGEEIGVFEVKQNQQTDHHPDNHSPFPHTLTLRMAHYQAQRIVQQSVEDQNQHEKPGGLIVEEETGEKQEPVAQEPLAMAEGEHREDKGKEGPEVELREQQRIFLIEGEDVDKESTQVIYVHRLQF